MTRCECTLRGGWGVRGCQRAWQLAGLGILLLGLACAPMPPVSGSTAGDASSPPTASPTTAPVAMARSREVPPSRTTVRVAHIGATISDSPLFIAEHRGYLAEEGLQVERTVFDSAARMIPALASNQVDVGGGAISAGLFNAVGRGVDLRIVADKGSMQPGDRWNSVVARTELLDSGALRDWLDLRGRSVGIPARGTGNEIVFARGLATAGLTLADIDLRELSLPDIGVGLANGSLDVGLQPEPLLTIGRDRGIFRVWKGQGDVTPGMQFTVVMYGSEFAIERTDAARRYMVAYVRGIRDYYDAFIAHRVDPQPLAEFIASYAHLSGPELVKRLYPVRFDPDGRVNAESIVSDYQYYRDTGQLNVQVDPQQLVDQQFVDYAVSRLGPYR